MWRTVVSGDPVLTPFQLPDAFYGTAGFVALNGRAPAGGALVTLTSSDPTAVVPLGLLGPASNVTIPAGSLGTPVGLMFLPASTTEDVTLTATYGGTSLVQVVPVTKWPPISIVPGAASLAKGEWATETVTINPIAPTGGATVPVTSSDPSALTVPTTLVIIPAGSYETSFTITGNYSGPRKQVTISAAVTTFHNVAVAA